MNDEGIVGITKYEKQCTEQVFFIILFFSISYDERTDIRNLN